MNAPAYVQANTLERFLDAWKRWNADDMIAGFSDDFTQATLPFSLGVPARSRAEVEHVFPKLVGVVDNYKLDVHEIIHDAENSKAAVYCTATGVSPFGPWAMEYAAFVTFNEEGDRIARLAEMLDSAFMKDFAPKFGRYLQEQVGTHL